MNNKEINMIWERLVEILPVEVSDVWIKYDIIRKIWLINVKLVFPNKLFTYNISHQKFYNQDIIQIANTIKNDIERKINE